MRTGFYPKSSARRQLVRPFLSSPVLLTLYICLVLTGVGLLEWVLRVSQSGQSQSSVPARRHIQVNVEHTLAQIQSQPWTLNHTSTFTRSRRLRRAGSSTTTQISTTTSTIHPTTTVTTTTSQPVMTTTRASTTAPASTTITPAGSPIPTTTPVSSSTLTTTTPAGSPISTTTTQGGSPLPTTTPAGSSVSSTTRPAGSPPPSTTIKGSPPSSSTTPTGSPLPSSTTPTTTTTDPATPPSTCGVQGSAVAPAKYSAIVDGSAAACKAACQTGDPGALTFVVGRGSSLFDPTDCTCYNVAFSKAFNPANWTNVYFYDINCPFPLVSVSSSTSPFTSTSLSTSTYTQTTTTLSSTTTLYTSTTMSTTTRSDTTTTTTSHTTTSTTSDRTTSSMPTTSMTTTTTTVMISNESTGESPTTGPTTITTTKPPTTTISTTPLITTTTTTAVYVTTTTTTTTSVPITITITSPVYITTISAAKTTSSRVPNPVFTTAATTTPPNDGDNTPLPTTSVSPAVNTTATKSNIEGNAPVVTPVMTTSSRTTTVSSNVIVVPPVSNPSSSATDSPVSTSPSTTSRQPILTTSAPTSQLTPMTASSPVAATATTSTTSAASAISKEVEGSIAATTSPSASTSGSGSNSGTSTLPSALNSVTLTTGATVSSVAIVSSSIAAQSQSLLSTATSAAAPLVVAIPQTSASAVVVLQTASSGSIISTPALSQVTAQTSLTATSLTPSAVASAGSSQVSSVASTQLQPATTLPVSSTLSSANTVSLTSVSSLPTSVESTLSPPATSASGSLADTNSQPLSAAQTSVVTASLVPVSTMPSLLTRASSVSSTTAPLVIIISQSTNSLGSVTAVASYLTSTSQGLSVNAISTAQATSLAASESFVIQSQTPATLTGTTNSVPTIAALAVNGCAGLTCLFMSRDDPVPLNDGYRTLDVTVNAAAQFAANYAPISIVLLIQTFWLAIFANIKLNEPFHQLAQPGGTPPDTGLLFEFLATGFPIDHFKHGFLGNWTSWYMITSYVVLLILHVVPSIAAEAFSIQNLKAYCVEDTGNDKCVRKVWTVAVKPVRTLQAALIIVAILVLVVLVVRTYRGSALSLSKVNLALVADTIADAQTVDILRRINPNAPLEVARPVLRGHLWALEPSVASQETATKVEHYTLRSRAERRATGVRPETKPKKEKSKRAERTRALLDLLLPGSIILVLFLLIILYATDSINNRSLTVFFGSVSFGPKFVLVTVTTILGIAFCRIEYEVRTWTMYRSLHEATDPFPLLERRLHPSPITQAFAAWKYRQWVCAFMSSMAGYGIHILAITISNVPWHPGKGMNSTIACIFISLGLLVMMAVGLISVAFWRRGNAKLMVARAPTTLADLYVMMVHSRVPGVFIHPGDQNGTYVTEFYGKAPEAKDGVTVESRSVAGD